MEEKFEECGIAVNKFIQKATPKEYSLEGLRRIAEFLNKAYQIDPIDSMKMEVLYIASLNMMKLFFYKEPIKEFFSKSEKRISIRFLNSNHQNLIIDLIDFYFNLYEIRLAALFTELLPKGFLTQKLIFPASLNCFGTAFMLRKMKSLFSIPVSIYY